MREEYLTENKNGKYTNQVEQAVDAEYFLKIRKQCEIEQWNSRGQSGLSAAAKRKLRPNCARLETMQQEHPAYVNDLLYGY